jgi:hypothetical protein
MARLPRVGAPDPERRTSPILDEDEELPADFGAEEGDGICYFNGIAYRAGQYVLSGSELLRCEKPGVWVRRGEMRSDRVEK